MTTLLCNACLQPLYIEDMSNEIIRCEHCLCKNRIIPGSVPKTEIVFDKESIKGAEKKITRISNDVMLFLKACKSYGMEYTEIINEGIALYINQLPEEMKRTLADYVKLEVEKEKKAKAVDR